MISFATSARSPGPCRRSKADTTEKELRQVNSGITYPKAQSPFHT